MGAVGVQECPCNIYDFFSAPFQHQPWLLGDNSHFHGFQVFLFGIGKELFLILRGNHHGHPLLGL